MRRALSTSSADGLKTPLAHGTWAGWMQSLPL